MIEVQKVQSVLFRMAELLRQGGLVDWAQAIEESHTEISNDPATTSAKILSMYGGMGSLNDLVLYKDGKVLIKESNELDELRSRLYDLCRAS